MKDVKPVKPRFYHYVDQSKWVTDITYIHTLKDGWTYLSTIQDLHTKKVIGWKFGKQMTKELVIETLDNALLNQTPPRTWSSTQIWVLSTLAKPMRQSWMNWTFGTPSVVRAVPTIMPVSNRFTPHSKEEVYPSKAYENFEAAYLALFQYIEGFYNRKRIHSSINYLTPNQMEELALQA